MEEGLLKQKLENLLRFDAIFALKNRAQIQEPKPIHADSDP
jgi:hypothetical protein